MGRRAATRIRIRPTCSVSSPTTTVRTTPEAPVCGNVELLSVAADVVGDVVVGAGVVDALDVGVGEVVVGVGDPELVTVVVFVNVHTAPVAVAP